MKTVKNLLMMAVLLVSLNQAINGKSYEYQERTKSFNANKGGTLNVNVNPGTIIIIPWDKDEVLIKAKGIDEDELENLEMSSAKNSVTVNFEADWGDSEAEFYINVPTKYNLQLVSSGGEIVVRGNIEGDINIKTAGGEITTKNIKGNIVANTAGGEIKIGDIEGSININTQGGDINIGFAKGNLVKAVTAGGDIKLTNASGGAKLKTSGGDIVVGDLGGQSEIFTSGGNIRIGNVNGGIKMETSGGDIKLKSAKGVVSARTSGGNLIFDKVIGSISAKTSAGDISIYLEPSANSDNLLSTSAGNIELKLPSSAKADIDAIVRIHGSLKYRRAEDNISSDFQAKTKVEDDNENELRATYKVNGGGSRIILRTSESNIRIKKVN